MAKKSKKLKCTYAVGRRRSASARVRLFKGKDQHIVNDMVIGEYFPGEINRTRWEFPFKLTNTVGKYYVTVKVIGGGKNGQLEATIHAISKAFNKLNKDKYRKVLKKAGLLTRDSRIRERRKVGTGGKARRKRQSPKR